MTRRVLLWVVMTLVASSAWTPAAAQSGSSGWDVLLTPYILGAAMDGTTTVRGRQVDVDASASDIFSNLQFGAMGAVVARKGGWGVGADLIWMALGTTVRKHECRRQRGRVRQDLGGSHRGRRAPEPVEPRPATAGVHGGRWVWRRLRLHVADLPDHRDQVHRLRLAGRRDRWLDVDYESGEGNKKFAYDALTQSPVAGFGFRF